MPYIYSTLPADCVFTSHLPKKSANADKPQNEVRIVAYKVLIKGGHGVATPGTFDTPNGVVTKVTDEELGFLLANDGFQHAMEKGHILFENKKEVSAEKMVRNMEKVSKSSPLTMKDLEVEETGPKDGKVYKLKRDV